MWCIKCLIISSNSIVKGDVYTKLNTISSLFQLYPMLFYARMSNAIVEILIILSPSYKHLTYDCYRRTNFAPYGGRGFYKHDNSSHIYDDSCTFVYSMQCCSQFCKLSSLLSYFHVRCRIMAYAFPTIITVYFLWRILSCDGITSM